MFSPLAFPNGLVLYDLSTTLPPASYVALSPFELYRESLVIVGIADGCDTLLDVVDTAKRDKTLGPRDKFSSKSEFPLLVRSLEDLIDRFSRALVHQILVFDHDEIPMPERIYAVPAPAKSKTTTIKTVMCDMTSRLLAEMAVFGKSLHNLFSLESPRVASDDTTTNGDVAALPAYLSDSSSTHNARQPILPSGDYAISDHRLSMPANLPSKRASGISTPNSRPATPSNGTSTPAEIKGSSAAQSPPRSTSHERTDSRGKVSTSASTNAGLGEREKNKGRGRIGIVIGAMYLLAGRWPDAVKELVQSAAIARNSSDYLWHAKAMDLVLVCLLMYAWAGMDFRVSLRHIDEINMSTSRLLDELMLNSADS